MFATYELSFIFAPAFKDVHNHIKGEVAQLVRAQDS
jgi:hypothetical protein